MADTTEMRENTVGESRVRHSFNPSANPTVDAIKQQTAALIDLCEWMKTHITPAQNSEQIRLCALAQTAYEEAAMWAVKAATA